MKEGAGGKAAVARFEDTVSSLEKEIIGEKAAAAILMDKLAK